jgi:hypothetical protein
MSKHTPGPWKSVASNSHRTFNQISIRPVTPAIKGMILPIAKVSTYDLSEYGGGTGSANARLISAAPDLLAALQEVEWEVEQYAEGFELLWGKVAAAIAKATGETI